MITGAAAYMITAYMITGAEACQGEAPGCICDRHVMPWYVHENRYREQMRNVEPLLPAAPYGGATKTAAPYAPEASALYGAGGESGSVTTNMGVHSNREMCDDQHRSEQQSRDL